MIQFAERPRSATQLLTAHDGAHARSLVLTLPPGESARLVSRLDRAAQRQLLAALNNDEAAQLLEELTPVQAAGLLRLLTPERAVALLERFPSNEQADLLAELGDVAEDIMALLPADAAAKVGRLAAYPSDNAGGLMVAETLVYSEGTTVQAIVDDLRANANRYARLQAQYAYVADARGRLVGVLRLRDLLLLEPSDEIEAAMTRDPLRVRPEATLDELARFFDRHPFYGVPVVDGHDRLLGIVLRADAEEALSARSDRRMLLSSGVLGGEEVRSLPWTNRLLRRVPWLAASLLLSLAAASVIGWYEETLAATIVLAVFLPVISGMGGNSGNQALAVSIRELSLGLVEPDEFSWIALKEATVGLASGLLLGLVLAVLSFAWHGDPRLSLVIGIALAANTVLAACLGGILPLGLKRFGWDPALASGPMLFTITDLCGFFLALALAERWLMAGAG
jgi:magnesium transporter